MKSIVKAKRACVNKIPRGAGNEFPGLVKWPSGMSMKAAGTDLQPRGGLENREAVRAQARPGVCSSSRLCFIKQRDEIAGGMLI